MEATAPYDGHLETITLAVTHVSSVYSRTYAEVEENVVPCSYGAGRAECATTTVAS